MWICYNGTWQDCYGNRVETFPIQDNRSDREVPLPVAEAAYVEYATLYGSQQPLARLGERGGFGASEIAILLHGRVQRLIAEVDRLKNSTLRRSMDSEQLSTKLDNNYDIADIMMRAGRLAELNKPLARIDVDATDTDILLGWLTATLPAKTQLPDRSPIKLMLVADGSEVDCVAGAAEETPQCYWEQTSTKDMGDIWMKCEE